MEQWKEFDFCKNYSWSTFWRIRNNRTWNIYIPQWFTNEWWYTQPRVVLRYDWKGHPHKVSRLIAYLFLWLEEKDSRHVLHIDDNPFNNNINNLFLWTNADNVRDRDIKWRTQKWDTHSKAKYKEEDFIKAIDLFNQWRRPCDIARMFWIKYSALLSVFTWHSRKNLYSLIKTA